MESGAHLAVAGPYDDTIAVTETERIDVGRGHEERVAHRSGERVLLLVHHGVELLAAACAQHEAAERHVDLRRCDGEEARPAVGRGEVAALAEARAAPLDRVTGGAQQLDPRVHGDDARDLVADLLPRRERALRGALGSDATREVDEDLPLAAHLARARTGDLRAERDAALGGRLGSA